MKFGSQFKNKIRNDTVLQKYKTMKTLNCSYIKTKR